MRMRRSLLPLFAALLFVGQGCFSPVTTIPLEEIDGSASPAPDGFVAFEKGYGLLPGKAPTSPIPPERQPSFILETPMPGLPPDVTVLREWDTAPGQTLLRNITTALDVPSGAIGNGARGEALSLTWHDAQQYHWTYDAPAHTLTAELKTATVPTAPGLTEERAAEHASIAAQIFLTERGIDVAGWGAPEVRLQPSGTWRVTFAASRDAQPVSRTDGVFLPAGDLTGTGQTVTYATMELPRSLDRSNYPALTSGEVLQRLRAGGTNPIQDAGEGATVTIEQWTTVLYWYEGVQGTVRRSFYIPALLATGTYRHAGTAKPYSTLVPLATDDSFAGTP